MIGGVEDKLLILTSKKSVNLLCATNSSRQSAVKIPIGKETTSLTISVDFILSIVALPIELGAMSDIFQF